MRPGEPSNDFESRVRVLFDRLAEADDATRRAALEHARGTDPDACREVEVLLSHHGRSGALLDESSASAAEHMGGYSSFIPHVGATIGTYKLTREIGRGGMGVVFEAEQSFPHRRVALKLMRPELVTQSLLRRFSHEADALALVQHPAVAQLYEAGFADAHQRAPFIAMELVEGVPITTYIKSASLPTADILSLFARVCDGVDHAHHRGVVHRDLKPVNILVGADGAPKVLDFGVARLTAPDSNAQTIATSAGVLIGTFGYMSPEQLDGDPRTIDARSDVFALGVILFELLAGRTPVDVGGLTVREALRTLHEREPELLGAIRPELKGDIEAITAKALEPSRDSRYQSAADLAADIRRFLAHEPVSARPQTTWYQARKFARRNRVLVAGLATVFCVLIAGIAATTWQAIRATRLREAGEIQAQRATQTAEFLKTMIQSATPEVARGRATTVREILDAATRDLDNNPNLQPEIAFELRTLLAESYIALQNHEPAYINATAAIQIISELEGPDSERTLRAIGVQCLSLSNQFKGQEALPIATEAAERAERLYGENNPVTIMLISQRGTAHMGTRPTQYKEARPYLERAVVLSEAAYGKRDVRTITAKHVLARCLNIAFEYKAAETIILEIIEARTALQDAEHPRTLSARQMLAATQYNLKNYDEAIATCEKWLPITERILTPLHSTSISFNRIAGDAYNRKQRFSDAIRHYAAAYTGSKAVYGTSSMECRILRSTYIQGLIDAGDCDTAAGLIEEHRLAVENPNDAHSKNTIAFQQFRLAGCRGDIETMRRTVDSFKGTMYDGLAAEALRLAETKAETKANRSTPSSNPPAPTNPPEPGK